MSIPTYTDQDASNWTMLFSQMLQVLPEQADERVLEGMRRAGIPADHIPSFEVINTNLSAYTDWELIPMNEMVEDKAFILMLADKQYPCRNWVRTALEVESPENEYDLFHDLIGHATLLFVPEYAAFLQGVGALAKEYLSNDKALLYLKRLYWHTVQFGLIESGKTIKIYGAHLITSLAETAFALSAGVPKYDWHIASVMDTPYVKDRYQEKYFVISSFAQLKDSLPLIRQELQDRLATLPA